MLGAICLIEDGHEIVLKSFTNFKSVMGEKTRFQKLMGWFKKHQEDVEFLHSCLQFINLVVHSVNMMNYRVHLQYEFELLGLDQLLRNLKSIDCERIKQQLQAFEDNMMDVGVLMTDADAKLRSEQEVQNLYHRVDDLNATIQDNEYEAMSKICELEKQLSSRQEEIEKLKGTGRGVFALPGVHYSGKPGEGLGGMAAGHGAGMGPGMGAPGMGVPGMGGMGAGQAQAHAAYQAQVEQAHAAGLPPPPPPAGLGLPPMQGKPKLPDMDELKDDGLKIKTSKLKNMPKKDGPGAPPPPPPPKSDAPPPPPPPGAPPPPGL